MVVGTSMVQIFTNLYFIQHKKIANIYTIVAYAIYIYLIFYVQIMGYDTVFPKANSIISPATQGAISFNLPIYLDFFLELDFILFNYKAFFYSKSLFFLFAANIVLSLTAF